MSFIEEVQDGLGFDIDSVSGRERRSAKHHLRKAGEPGHELLVRIGEDQIDFEARAMLGEAQDQQFDRRLKPLSILRDADNQFGLQFNPQAPRALNAPSQPRLFGMTGTANSCHTDNIKFHAKSANELKYCAGFILMDIDQIPRLSLVETQCFAWR